ncbi:MAG: DUF3047 domain-containing protein [Bdellovibrionales bacterium]|nr:DUF3047 domain-containing protein [Bdellovibrionales bacterium]
MKRFSLLIILGMGLNSMALDPVAILEDFEGFSKGDVPSKGWRTRDGSARGIYEIAEENGNKFLRATYTTKSVQYFKESGWNISAHPWLVWKWRVHDLPKGADERKGETNDSAAGVYVLFPGKWFIPRTIKYVWSTTVPVGTVIKRDDRFPVIVLRSGAEHKDKWVFEKRNVLEDYKELFDLKLANPKAIGFLTDANSVKGKASADYDDFKSTSDPGLLQKSE